MGEVYFWKGRRNPRENPCEYQRCHDTLAWSGDADTGVRRYGERRDLFMKGHSGNTENHTELTSQWHNVNDWSNEMHTDKDTTEINMTRNSCGNGESTRGRERGVAHGRVRTTGV